MEKRTALAPEELAGLYRRHIKMVSQICLLMLKTSPTRRTPPRRSSASAWSGGPPSRTRSGRRPGSSSPPATRSA